MRKATPVCLSIAWRERENLGGDPQARVSMLVGQRAQQAQHFERVIAQGTDIRRISSRDRVETDSMIRVGEERPDMAWCRSCAGRKEK